MMNRSTEEISDEMSPKKKEDKSVKSGSMDLSDCDDSAESCTGGSRLKQRRATDFSQADNDLRRFLAEREQKRRDSDQDLQISPTSLANLTSKSANIFTFNSSSSSTSTPW